MSGFAIDLRDDPDAAELERRIQRGFARLGLVPLRRYEDWLARLEHELGRADRRPFAWGLDGCALMAANCVYRMTGVDLAADFRGRYRDAAGAWAALEAVTGAGDLPRACRRLEARYRLEPVAPARAQRGDLALVDPLRWIQADPARRRVRGIELGPSLGVVDPTGRRIATKGADELMLWPIAAAMAAWRVR